MHCLGHPEANGELVGTNLSTRHKNNGQSFGFGVPEVDVDRHALSALYVNER